MIKLRLVDTVGEKENNLAESIKAWSINLELGVGCTRLSLSLFLGLFFSCSLELTNLVVSLQY